jgi:hypothetical protein
VIKCGLLTLWEVLDVDIVLYRHCYDKREAVTMARTKWFAGEIKMEEQQPFPIHPDIPLEPDPEPDEPEDLDEDARIGIRTRVLGSAGP